MNSCLDFHKGENVDHRPQCGEQNPEIVHCAHVGRNVISNLKGRFTVSQSDNCGHFPSWWQGAPCFPPPTSPTRHLIEAAKQPDNYVGRGEVAWPCPGGTCRASLAVCHSALLRVLVPLFFNQGTLVITLLLLLLSHFSRVRLCATP